MDKVLGRLRSQFGNQHEDHALKYEAPYLPPEDGSVNAEHQKRAERIPRLSVPRDA